MNNITGNKINMSEVELEEFAKALDSCKGNVYCNRRGRSY